MSSSRRRHRSSSAPPLDDENLLPEILLRLPPQPSSLPRASLVCKRWRRLASDPGFLRRFRIHHRRSPPLLGCFVEQLDGISFVPTLEGPNRVPPGRFSLQFKHGNGFMLLDCRHGLVLLSAWMRRQFVVWDPVTGDQNRVAVPAGLDPKTTEISGAVLRAAGDVQHFQVVCVATRCDDIQHGEAAAACVYSSETGIWGNLVSIPIPSGSSIELYRMLSFRTISREPAVLVGDSIYWILTTSSTSIVEFNFETQSLAVTRVPHVHIDHFKVIRADSGGLGFLYMSESDFTVQLWKPKTNCDVLASCRLGRTIELDKLLPVNQEKDNILIVGFAEENNMVFLRTLKGLYAVHLQSLELKNLPEINGRPHYYPFESVYTSDVGGKHGRAELFAQCIG